MSEIKTKLEVIRETVDYYSKDVTRRSMNGSDCMYVSSDGKNCAFSRCCADPSSLKSYEGYGASQVIDKFGFECLKPEYMIEDKSFWNELQALHDIKSNWNETGLTDEGRKYVAELENKYLNQ